MNLSDIDFTGWDFKPESIMSEIAEEASTRVMSEIGALIAYLTAQEIAAMIPDAIQNAPQAVEDANDYWLEMGDVVEEAERAKRAARDAAFNVPHGEAHDAERTAAEQAYQAAKVKYDELYAEEERRYEHIRDLEWKRDRLPILQEYIKGMSKPDISTLRAVLKAAL